MARRCVAVTAVVLAAAFLSGASDAEIIVSFSGHDGAGGPWLDPQSSFVEVGASDDIVDYPDTPWVFQGLTFTLDDVGQTFTATRFTDPNFVALESWLTDGINNTFLVKTGSDTQAWSMWTPWEADFIGPYTPNGIDFQGHTIDRIDLLIDAMTLSPGTWALDWTVTFVASPGEPESAVPEPGTIAMVALAQIATLTALRRARG